MTVRVAVVAHSFIRRGDQQKYRDIAARHDIRVHLLVPARWRFYPWQERETAADESDDLLQVTTADVTFEGRTGAHLYSPFTVARFLGGARPDLVHIEEEAFSLVTAEVAALARRRGIPYSLFVWENIDKRIDPVRHRLRRWVLRGAAGLVGGSRLAVDICRHHGFTGPSAVLPQVGIGDGHRTAGQQQPRTRSRTVGARPRVGFSGRLVPEKGVDLLLRAAGDLRRSGLPLDIIVVGDGPERPALEQVAAAEGVDDLVAWLGGVPPERSRAAIAELDVLVLPSRSTPAWSEQFGLVIVEAMAQGVPVLGARSGAIPDVIGTPEAVFPEDDAAALSQLLRRVLTEPGVHDRLAAHGRDRYAHHYSRTAVADRYAAAWEAFAAAG